MSVAAKPSSRWRVFADAVAVALGVNVWVSLVLLPGLYVRAWPAGSGLLVAALPLAVLCAGIWRRNEIVLLLGYPAALLVPVALAPEMVAAHVYGPVRFAVVGLGLVAYLFGASVFTSFYEPPPPLRLAPLSGAASDIPERWRRRFRVYAELAVLAAIFPATLLYVVNFDQTGQDYLRTMYPGRAALFSTLLNLGVIAVWALLYAAFFLGALRPHRTGDRALLSELAGLRKLGGLRRPRASLYAGVVAATILVIVLLFYRG